RKKRAKKEKDPNAPKRPATSYILYQNDCRQAMKEQNPGLHNTDLLRYISETWKKLPEPEKSSYEQKAAKLKHDYEDAVKEY
ncbi:high mobility group box domain-containing protein, partial [Schizophyllum fasciatum]